MYFLGEGGGECLKSWCVTFRPSCIILSLKSSKVTDVIHPGFVDFKRFSLGVGKILFRTPYVPGFPQVTKTVRTEVLTCSGRKLLH